MAVEAPGGIDTTEGYWELLSHGREALGPFPTDRGWRVRELLAGSRRSGFKEIHDCGGFLTGATTFDPEFFGISPRRNAMDFSNASRFGCRGVHSKTAASIPTTWPATTWVALSARPLPDMGPR